MRDRQSFHDLSAGDKRAGRPLRKMAEELRLMLESAKDHAIFTMDVEGRILTWNSGAQRTTGYGAGEIVGKHFSVFYTPEDIRQGKPENNLREAASKGRCEDEGWRVRKDGSHFWAKAAITAFRDKAGSLREFGKVIRDMTSVKAVEEELRKANEALDFKVRERTAQLQRANAELQAENLERRRAEEKLESSFQQLRALSAHEQAVREEERGSISREVHDELGQSLTALKMDLTWLKQRLSARSLDEEQISKRIESALRLVDETIQSVRRIAAELRPGVLDDLGLAAAIEWQAEEFQARTGITCELRISPENIPLDLERTRTTFRIFQEILSNIARHAEATQVQVRLMRSAHTVILEVRDNGKGIRDEEIANPKSLGLLGMRERSLLLDGHFGVHGEEGRGTTVVVQIPVQKPFPGDGA